MNLEKTIKNLKIRGFQVSHFATGAEAAEYLNTQIKGKTVGFGGCSTAKELGLYESLSQENTCYWHWIEPGHDTIAKANAAEVYISSVNAMTESGELINIDGNGNRIAATAYGNGKKVYFVVSTNKICPDFESALYRARNTAAVQNIKRFDVRTPCKIDDKCHDCHGDNCMCRIMMVHWGPSRCVPTEVVLIDEKLGM